LNTSTHGLPLPCLASSLGEEERRERKRSDGRDRGASMLVLEREKDGKERGEKEIREKGQRG